MPGAYHLDVDWEGIPLKVEIENIDSCKKTLKIEVPPEDVNAEFEKAYEEVRKNAEVPGFRKGRAPHSVIKMRFSEFIKAEVVDNLVPPMFEKAAEEANLVVLRPPDTAEAMKPAYKDLVVKENESLSFEVTIDVKPEISVPQLEQLEVDKNEVDVPKEDVDKRLEQLREERAEFIPVEDRSAQEGDYVTLDILGTLDEGDIVDSDSGDADEDIDDSDIDDEDLDDEDVDDEEDEDLEDDILIEEYEEVYKLGEDMPIPEMAQHVVGMNVDDKKKFSITFPEDYKDEGLAGKEVFFQVELFKVTERQLPELDDDFAKDLDEDDLQHLNSKVWNDLIDAKKQEQRGKQETELVDQLLEKSEFDVPDFLIEDRVNSRIRIDRYFAQDEESEITEEQLEEYRSTSLKNIRTMWLLEKIAGDEEIEVTDEEVYARIDEMAKERDRDPIKFRKALEDTNRIEGLRASIWEQEIFDLLIEKAAAKRTLIV